VEEQRRNNPEDEVIAALAGKRRWSREDGKTALAALRRSGLKLEPFAKQHGLVAQRLRWWRDQLGDNASEPSSAVADVKFTPVRLVEKPHEASKPDLPRPAPASRPPPEVNGMEVVLTNGRRIRVPSDFDASSLARLLSVAEGRLC
jgi:transposase-like protein